MAAGAAQRTLCGWLPARVVDDGRLTQGQDLIWGKPEFAFQGIPELTACERTKDLWLQDVQEEFRYSQLGSNTHAFLHGLPTTVPGSWLRGKPQCGLAACEALVRQRVTPQSILARECAACRQERASRRLVATDAEDPRFLARFVGAPSVFATNVRKCHTNKVRAEAYAARARAATCTTWWPKTARRRRCSERNRT